MHAVMYAWDLGERFDGESLRRRARERGHLYERLPGLLSKAFIMDESSRRFGGFYLFARVDLSWANPRCVASMFPRSSAGRPNRSRLRRRVRRSITP